jgi:hypothetical protein
VTREVDVNRFPGFKKCLAMMRDRDPQTREDGFHGLLPRAREFLPQLIDEFRAEKQPGVRCCLLEMIGEARSDDALDVLASALRGAEPNLWFWAAYGLKKLDSKPARELLWQAKSFMFRTEQETQEFRQEVERALAVT